MSMIKGSFGPGADFPTLNAASRRDSAQRKALERVDSGAKGLSTDELKADRAQLHRSTGFDAQGSSKLMKRVDTDADGTLTGAELDAAKALVPPPKDTMEFVQRRLGSESDSQVRGTVFQQIDADGDGGLRKSEFVAAGPTHRPGVEDQTPDGVATAGGSADAAYEQLAKVFDAADRDGDGALGKDEYLRLKAEVRESAADLLGISPDAQSLTESAGVDAYRQDRFDLVDVARTLAER